MSSQDQDSPESTSSFVTSFSFDAFAYEEHSIASSGEVVEFSDESFEQVSASSMFSGAPVPAPAPAPGSAPAQAPAPAGAVPPQPVPVPQKPIMGDLVQVGGYWTPWCGGQPMHDWSGLDATAPTTCASPNQYRPESTKGARESYNHRRHGLKEPFVKGKSSLPIFVADVWKHMVDNGMDPIGYLPDPADATKMISFVEEHPKMDLEVAKTATDALSSHWDKYDHSNDRAASDFLLESLDSSLKADVERKLSSKVPHFSETWYQFLRQVHSVTSRRYEQLKQSIKSLRASQFPGENVDSLSKKFIDLATELELGGVYDHELTKYMLEAFIEAGGDIDSTIAGNYRHDLRNKLTELDAALKEIRFNPDQSARDTYMETKKLGFREICDLAEEKYRALYTTNRWPPAQTKRDSRRVPQAYVAAVSGAPGDGPMVCLSQPQLNALVHAAAGSGRDKSRDKCNKCGTLGHWARDCPQNSSNTPNNRTRGRNGRNFSRGRDGNSQVTGGNSWRKSPPGPNETETKTVSGKPYKWCGKCKRWNTTHVTVEHTKGAGKTNSQSSQSPQANVAAAPALCPDPGTGEAPYQIGGSWP